MGFPRQECWSGLPFPSPGDRPDPGIEPGSLTSLLHWQVGSFLPVPPRKLGTKISLQKTAAPAPSASSAEPVRSAAQCWKCPLWGLSWSPCHWPAVSGWPSSIVGDTAKAECPPGTAGGDLAHLPSQGRFHDKTPSPPRAGTPRALSVTTRQDDRCDVGQHRVLPVAQPPSLSPPVTEDGSQLPVHPPNLKISHQFKIVCYTFLKATGKEVFSQ